MRIRKVGPLVVLLAGCKFPDLPPLSEDGAGGDSAVADAAGDGTSSGDAPVDADLPIVTNNQTADLVLGAADFTSIRGTGFTAISVRPF